jgi:hypothetical protein
LRSPFILLLFGLCAFTLGCTSIPSAPSVVPDPALREGYARIIFYRPNKTFGYGTRSDILLNSTRVGRSLPGRWFHVDVVQGTHEVVVPHSLYPGKNSIVIELLDQERIYIRTLIGVAGFVGRIDIEVIEDEVALAEIVGLTQASD